MDTLILSRIQFGANISFHILFPTITIALGWILLFFKVRYQRTGDEVWMDAYRFWVKVFSLTSRSSGRLVAARMRTSTVVVLLAPRA